MTITRRLFLSAAALPIWASVAPARERASPVNTLAGGGIAIHGYDPVAYSIDGLPRQGRPDLTLHHGGAVWRFASAVNRKRFVADPASFVPAFGGYCAYGVSQGYLVKIDPEAWTIRLGRLYLNYDLSVRAIWLRDAEEFIALANRRWPRLIGAA